MPTDVVFMHHGLWGKAIDLIHVAEGLKRQYGCTCIMLDNNVGRTTQGIVNCGKRCLNAILQVCDKLEPGSKVSFVGHSLGGLILLEALNLLVTERPTYFDDRSIICENFMPVASPLLGLTNSVSGLITWFAGVLPGRTFDDLILKTDDLTALCTDQLFDRLRKFNRLILVGNLIDDPAVTPMSSLFLADNSEPYPEFESIVSRLPNASVGGPPSEFEEAVHVKQEELRLKWLMLPWMRFAFRLPRQFGDFGGTAHHKIIMNPRRDLWGRGAAAVAEIVNLWHS